MTSTPLIARWRPARASLALSLAALGLGGAARAELPAYSLELLARANAPGNPSGSFRIPQGWSVSSETPKLNDAGQLAFRVTTTNLSHALFFGDRRNGGIVYETPTEAFMFEAAINGGGDVVFSLGDLPSGQPPGLYLFRSSTGNPPAFFSNQPEGTSSWSSPTLDQAGRVSLRASFPGYHAHVVVDPSGATSTVYVRETAGDPESPYAFLYSPSMNENGQIASVASPSISPTVTYDLRRWQADGSSVRIAADDTVAPGSPFRRFDSTSPSINDAGVVSFAATLVGGGRGVFRSDGTTTTTIALEGVDGVDDLEFFPTSLNHAGLVAFRAFDANGRRVGRRRHLARTRRAPRRSRSHRRRHRPYRPTR